MPYRDEHEVLKLKDQLEKLGAAHDRLIKELDMLLVDHQQSFEVIQNLEAKLAARSIRSWAYDNAQSIVEWFFFGSILLIAVFSALLLTGSC